MTNSLRHAFLSRPVKILFPDLAKPPAMPDWVGDDVIKVVFSIALRFPTLFHVLLSLFDANIILLPTSPNFPDIERHPPPD